MATKPPNPRTHCLHCRRALDAKVLASLASQGIKGLYGFCSTACEFNYGVALHTGGGRELGKDLRALLSKIVLASEVIQIPSSERATLIELAKLSLVTLHGKYGAKATVAGEVSFIRSRTVREIVLPEPEPEPEGDLDRAERNAVIGAMSRLDLIAWMDENDQEF